MGTISSGVGLISGMNFDQIIRQLMAIEGRPLQLLQQRIVNTQAQKTAYTALSAQLTAAQGAISRLASSSSFGARKATSSNPAVLTASATNRTPLDTFTFQVRSLVTTHELVSSGFADRTARVGAGTLTFEIGQGRVDNTTSLSVLNGFTGVRRGVMRITDGAGRSAEVDLTGARTIDGVLDAINSQMLANVTARVDGDRIVVTDHSSGPGPLVVQDLAGGHAAEDLGIAGSDAGGEILGRDLVTLTDGTRLAVLNDRTGVRVDGLGDDFRVSLSDGREITVNLSGNLRFQTNLGELNDGDGVRLGTIRVTNRRGQTADLDLSGAHTIQDVLDALTAAALDVSIALSEGKILVTDASGATDSNLKVEDVTGHAAEDLGILGDTDANSITGSVTYRVDTIRAVRRAILYAGGNIDSGFPNGALTVSISADGNGLVLTDHTSGGSSPAVTALNGSLAARDLGLLGGFSGGTLQTRNLIPGLNTVLLASLNGGQGVRTGGMQFTLRDGSTVLIDVSGAQTLQDVIAAIDAAASLSARIDTGGTGIIIEDTTAGSGTLSVTDVSGSTSADLNLTSAAAGRLVSGDVQLQYISENTRLADLNHGGGVDFAGLLITDSSGASRGLTVNASVHETVGDIIKAINNLGAGVTARINAHGDGLELEDTAGGTGRLTVQEQEGGSAAADLGILGTADDSNVLTGSFAGSVEITATDTLDDLVQKINEAGVGVTARIINDGTEFNPYRLVLSSQTSGTAGRIAFSTGGVDLSLDTLTEAQDATIVVGEPSSPNAIFVTSTTNTLDDVVEGLTLNLLGTDDGPVRLTVDHDIEQTVTDIKTFVKTINDIFDRIDSLSRYDPETEQRGLLLGDGTIHRIRDRLVRMITTTVREEGLSLTRASQVGLSIGSGARLQFDEERFRAVFEEKPEEVAKLFTLVTTGADGRAVNEGIGTVLKEGLEGMTTVAGGIITRQNETLQARVDLFEQRAEYLQKLLDQKEARLYAQFQAMEKALAALQAQQSSLGALTQLAATGAGISLT